MSKIAEVFADKINQVSNPPLKTFLLEHVNPKAETQAGLFCKEPANPRKLPTGGRAVLLDGGFSYQNALSMVFAYAPEEVCEKAADVLLGMKSDDMVALLSASRIHPAHHSLNERVMHTLLHYAPSSTRKKLLTAIRSLPMDSVVTLLFGKSYLRRYFTVFMELLNTEDKDSVDTLLSILHDYAVDDSKKSQLFDLFQTDPLPSRAYTALIDLFNLPLTESQALLVLSLLQVYDQDNLNQLLAGVRGQWNLLHRVFATQSEPIVARLLTILDKLPDSQLRALLTAQASFKQHETPLSLAFARKNCPGIACRLIDFLNQREALKPLLNATSIQQAYSPLQHAVLQQNTAAVAHYLQQSAPTKHIDSQSLLRLAQSKDYHDLVYLLAIHQAIDRDDRQALANWVNNTNADVAKAWAYALNNAQQTTPAYLELQTALGELGPRSFSDTLMGYCVREKDTYLYFLLLTGQLLASRQEPQLESAVKNLIETHLHNLSTQTHHVTTNAVQLQLITLFFTLPHAAKVKCLTQLNLDEKQKKQWATVLFRGLIQPAIFSTLSLEEHAFFLETLKQLSGEQHLHASLAAHYLLHAPLIHLPPQWLLTLSELATVTQLSDCIRNKRNPLLIVLTLQKILKADTPDLALIADLYKQLAQELALIRQNQTPMSEKEIALLLNLTALPAVKQFIRKKWGNSINQTVEKDFTHYHSATVLLPQGLLRDMILQHAAAPQTVLDARNHAVYSELFSITTPEETSTLLSCLRPALDHAMAHRDDALIKLNHASFHETLHRLRRQRHRLQLAPLIEQLDLLLQSLPPKPALNEFKNNLTLLCNDLSDRQVKSESPVSDTTLQALLKATHDSFLALNESGPELLNNSAWPIPDFAEVIQGIQTVARQIKTQEDTSDSQANTRPSLEEQERFLSQWRAAVIRGLLTNPHIDQQLSPLFYWFFMEKDFNPDDPLHEQIQALSETLKPDAWQPIQQQLDNLLWLRHATADVFFMFNTLLQDTERLNMESLLNCLKKIPVASLEQFKDFCALCDHREMQQVIDYVIEAKIMELPHNTDAVSLPDQPCQSIGLWLHESLDYLEQHTTRALSCKALISGFDLKKDPHAELTRLNQLVAEHGVSLDAKTLAFFIRATATCLDQSLPLNNAGPVILLLNDLLNQHRVLVVTDMMKRLPAQTITTLTQHCLRGLNSSDTPTSHACRNLMTLLCECASQSEEHLEIIKKNLGYQDLSLLGDEKLVKIAHTTLTEEGDNLTTSTLNGLWIQRLLTSPRFVAASTPKTIRALIERYRFLSLTLKQAEFEQLNAHIKGHMEFFEHHTNHLARVDSLLTRDINLRARLLEKRQRLLQFRADDSIRALLMQLEDSCFALRKDNPLQANAALHVLYTHYNHSLSSLRSDWLFKVADFVFIQSTENKGDVALAQSTFLTWLQQYLPHKNWEQSELSRKQSVLLYDVTGKKIGFINEANHAMTFVDDVPRPLIELRGYSAGMQVYDSNRYTLGFLLPSGEVKRVNIFQQNTSALLLAKVPVEQLSASTATMELLLADVVNEESLTRLYSESDSQKQIWVKKQLEGYVGKINKPLPASIFELLVRQHEPATVYGLLASMPCSKNSQSLFHAILANEAARKPLFGPDLKPAFHAYLDKHNPVDILSDFIARQHAMPCFAQGLQAFADYASTHNCPDLLIQALNCLNETKNKSATLEKEWDAILTALIDQEDIAKIIWRHFLNATINSPLSGIDSTLAQLTAFFKRKHCTPAIEAVNQLPLAIGSGSYQYRLLLLILQRQRHAFFQRVELRYSADHWTSQELSSYSLFVKRHFGTVTPLDEDKKTGKELLSELVLRCANYGNTSLFYQKNQFDSHLATLHFERNYLNAIAARDFLPVSFKNKLQNLAETLKGWFNGEETQKTQKTLDELKANKAIIDWKKINEQTWAVTNSVKMPLISAYLANYSGGAQPLKTLLDDYCKTENADLLPLSSVMMKLPARNVSSCVFQTLESRFTAKPALMDYTLFSHMASYHAQTHLKRKSLSAEASQLALIQHFGQQKKYALVQQACQLFKDNSQEKNYHQKVERIHKEAMVEDELNAHVGSWYFKFWQLIKRWWHYGLTHSKTPSESVVFCDKESHYASPVMVPHTITTPELNGGLIQAQMEIHNKVKRLKQRYEVFVAQQPPNPFDALLPPIADLKKELFFKDCRDDPFQPPSFQEGMVY